MDDTTLIVFDLEATCWDIQTKGLGSPEASKQRNEMEIIEIGAVKVNLYNYEPIDTFQIFAQPVLNPNLSEFCRTLTTIKQSDVSKALLFRDVYPKFIEWAGNPTYFVGWGQYDYNQIASDCDRWGLTPFPADKYVNGKVLYKQLTGRRGKGLSKAVKHYRLEFEGTHHRAISDAIMTAKVLKNAFLENNKR